MTLELTEKEADFNPHTREGCDNFILKTNTDWELISIHTPAKGATADKN